MTKFIFVIFFENFGIPYNYLWPKTSKIGLKNRQVNMEDEVEAFIVHLVEFSAWSFFKNIFYEKGKF